MKKRRYTKDGVPHDSNVRVAADDIRRLTEIKAVTHQSFQGQVALALKLWFEKNGQ